MKEDERIKKIIQKLRQTYPEAKCSLDFKSPFQLLVATILSAQCTDKRVNEVTPKLFKKFPKAESMAKASLPELENYIRSTGFFRQKAKSLKGMSQSIANDCEGKIPLSIEELTKLPGIGRKTANVVLGNAFHIPAGVVVDTHVGRLSFRLGLTKHKDAQKIERDLNEKIPKKHWVDFPHWLIQHGRLVCSARSPKCSECPLLSLCPQKGVEARHRQGTAGAKNASKHRAKQRQSG